MINKIKELLAEMFYDESISITESTTLEELGLDELDQVELIMAVEEEFNIDIPDNKAEVVETIGDVIKLIEEYK